jgi:integrase
MSLVSPAKPKAARPPSYCLHKPSGMAVVYINRQAVYLGAFGSAESWERYWQTISTLGTKETNGPPNLVNGVRLISIAELVERYLAHAQGYYVPDSERLYTIRAAVRPLLGLFASTDASAFGPLALEAVRDHRISQGRSLRKRKTAGGTQEWRPLCRTYINALIQSIIRVFDWAAGRELVPVTVPAALRKLRPILKRKNSRVVEPTRVKPVPLDHVEAVLRLVSPEIAAMIKLQILTAARPDEVTGMRSCDIDSTGDIWIYTLRDRSQGGIGHKTDHLDDDIERSICLGPHAQELIKPFLRESSRADEFLFSPRRATARRYQNGHGRLRPTERYDDGTYCQAVKRACKRAGVPIWTPNRLRHNRATEVRAVFGLEHAQAVLDHRSIETTQIYAERQIHLKREVALRIG